MNSTKKAFTFLSTSALAVGAAHGAVLYTPINVTITGNTALALDLNQDGTPDYLIQFNANAAAKPYITTAPAGATSSFVLSASSNQALPVTTSGTTIDGSYQSAQSGGYFNQDGNANTVGSWTASGNIEGYVGLELTDGAGTHFGWAHVIYNSGGVPANDNDTGTLTVVDIAMESAPGVAIQAGQTAEIGDKPVVDLPPVSQTGYLGGTVQLTANATGFPTPTFQWQSGAVGSGIYSNISSGVVTTDGANSTLTLSNLKMANMADYVVVTSNASGVVTSAVPATLTVVCASETPATLVNRYSFQDPAGSSSFADSVGGPDWAGSLSGDATLTGSGLLLDGTSGTYGILPPYITSDYTQITVEFWADIGEQTGVWTRVFSFGNQSGSGTKQSGFDFAPNATSGFQNLDALNNSGVDVYANNNVPLINTTGSHVTVVVDSVNGAFYYYNGTNLVSQLHDNDNPIAGTLLASSSGVPMSMADMEDVNNVIGASLNASDPYLVGTIHEFRIYQGVLSAQAIALNDAVGPANYIEVSATPTVSASLNGGNLVLSWPVSNINFVAQSASTLTGEGGWTTLTNVPVLVGSNWQITVPSAGAAKFFQLVHK